MLISEGLQKIENIINESKFDCLIDYLSKEGNMNLEKYNSCIEYEMKLDYFGEKEELGEIYNLLGDYLSKQDFFIDSIGKYSDYDIEYFSNGEELSLFLYEDKPLLKIKNHKTIDHNGYTIFCNRESFNYDISDIRKTLISDKVQHLATMNKKRIKDFLICKKNLIVYASALTLCKVNDKIQLQYELEYYRHIPVEGIEVNEELILNELSIICSLINKDSNNTFAYGSELKCDFARSHYTNLKTKEEAINNVLF